MKTLKAGEFVGSFQFQAEAPVALIWVERTRSINGRLITGTWSDPWWAYSPDRGWAIVRRWRNKAYKETPWSPAVPAANTLILNEVGPDIATVGPEIEETQ